MSAADPFYLVREEIEESVTNVEKIFLEWEHQATGPSERSMLRNELLRGIESVDLQVSELDKAISVAERDPTRFGLDGSEVARRRKWFNETHIKIETMRNSVYNPASSTLNVRRELMRMDDYDRTGPKPNRNMVGANDDFLVAESERQALILKEQDEDLDELSATVVRIGDVGWTLHQELGSQESILNDLDRDMDETAGRLEFVQKRVAVVIKKAGARGQLCLIIGLTVLLMVLIMLVFFT